MDNAVNNEEQLSIGESVNELVRQFMDGGPVTRGRIVITLADRAKLAGTLHADIMAVKKIVAEDHEEQKAGLASRDSMKKSMIKIVAYALGILKSE